MARLPIFILLFFGHLALGQDKYPTESYCQKCTLDSLPARFFLIGERGLISDYYNALENDTTDKYKVMLIYFGINPRARIIEINSKDSIKLSTIKKDKELSDETITFYKVGGYKNLDAQCLLFNGFYNINCMGIDAEDMVLLVISNARKSKRIEIASLVGGESGLFECIKNVLSLKEFITLSSPGTITKIVF